jgi:hypothetical protein
MREFAQKPNQCNDSADTAKSRQNELKLRQEIHPTLHLQHLVGNQAVQPLLLLSNAEQRRYSAQRAATDHAAMFIGGGDAPMPIRPLTEEDRSFDLQAERFRDDARLQAAFDNNPPLRMGETGPAVKKLQQALIDLGLIMPKSTKSGEPDGIYGQETSTVVKGFQWRQGIVKDGVVGRQTMGELDGLFSGQSPPGTRPSGSDQPGSEISVSEVERSPKRFGACGAFSWGVDWQTNARNGYLVQEIVRELEITLCGAQVMPPENLGTSHYWEAWRVQEDGGVHGAKHSDDIWLNATSDPEEPKLDPSLASVFKEGYSGTKGRWEITGRVFFVNQLDPGAGFKSGTVASAGSLWATETQPTNLGKELLFRHAGDSWNCCVGDSKDESEERKGTEN